MFRGFKIQDESRDKEIQDSGFKIRDENRKEFEDSDRFRRHGQGISSDSR